MKLLFSSIILAAALGACASYPREPIRPRLPLHGRSVRAKTPSSPRWRHFENVSRGPRAKRMRAEADIDKCTKDQVHKGPAAAAADHLCHPGKKCESLMSPRSSRGTSMSSLAPG